MKIHFYFKNFKSNFIINEERYVIRYVTMKILRHYNDNITHYDISYLILCQSYAGQHVKFQHAKWLWRFQSHDELLSSKAEFCLVCWRFQFVPVLDLMPKLILSVTLENEFCISLLRRVINFTKSIVTDELKLHLVYECVQHVTSGLDTRCMM